MAAIKIILRRRNIAVWAGIIWPIAFILVFILAGFFHIKYNPFEMYISELSIGSYGWIQIVNFIILGVSFLLFTYSIAYEFHDGKLAKIGLILLAIIGFSLILSGPFITDPMKTPRNLWTIHGTIHQIFGAIVFLLMPVSCFIFWRCFRNNLRWKSFQLWTFIAGAITAAAVILLRIASIQTPFSSILADWLGLIQRITLITYLIWIFTFALGLFKRTNGNFREYKTF